MFRCQEFHLCLKREEYLQIQGVNILIYVKNTKGGRNMRCKHVLSISEKSYLSVSMPGKVMIHECNYIKKTISTSYNHLRLSFKNMEIYHKCTVFSIKTIRESEILLDLPTGVINRYHHDRIRSIRKRTKSTMPISYYK